MQQSLASINETGGPRKLRNLHPIPVEVEDNRPPIFGRGICRGLVCGYAWPIWMAHGLRVFTEALQHALRNLPNCQVEARLFLPGFVYSADSTWAHRKA
jgi:hypothetical protein